MGGRSAKAQEKLKSLGFNHVIDLEGGYDAVKANN
jgi:rhodanese-related sulfurtransferase